MARDCIMEPTMPTPKRNPRPRISCVVPAYNEARNLGPLLMGLTERLSALTDQWEILIVDDGSRDALRQQLSMRGPLVAAGSFHHHQAGRVPPRGLDQPLDPRRIVADPQTTTRGRQVTIEPGLADIQADDLLFHPSPILVCGLAPLNRSGS